MKHARKLRRMGTSTLFGGRPLTTVRGTAPLPVTLLLQVAGALCSGHV